LFEMWEVGRREMMEREAVFIDVRRKERCVCTNPSKQGFPNVHPQSSPFTEPSDVSDVIFTDKGYTR